MQLRQRQRKDGAAVIFSLSSDAIISYQDTSQVVPHLILAIGSSDHNDEDVDEEHSDAAVAAWDDGNGVDEDKLMTWNSVTHTLPPQLKPFLCSSDDVDECRQW